LAEATAASLSRHDSKTVRCGSPTLGRFDSGAAPFSRFGVSTALRRSARADPPEGEHRLRPPETASQRGGLWRECGAARTGGSLSVGWIERVRRHRPIPFSGAPGRHSAESQTPVDEQLRRRLRRELPVSPRRSAAGVPPRLPLRTRQDQTSQVRGCALRRLETIRPSSFPARCQYRCASIVLTPSGSSACRRNAVITRSSSLGMPVPPSALGQATNPSSAPWPNHGRNDCETGTQPCGLLTPRGA
jgi:hypothetical protein